MFLGNRRLWPRGVFNALDAYLQTQGVVVPQMLIALFFVGVNLGLNWFVCVAAQTEKQHRNVNLRNRQVAGARGRRLWGAWFHWQPDSDVAVHCIAARCPSRCHAPAHFEAKSLAGTTDVSNLHFPAT
jgi:hypothetical protein